MGSAEVFKAGSALAGGVARRGETCGALTGAIMAVCSSLDGRGLKIGSNMEKRWKKPVGFMTGLTKKSATRFVAEIHKKRYGKVYHLNIPEERTAFHEMGGHSRTGCPEVCGIAARIAAEVLLGIKERELGATRQDS